MIIYFDSQSIYENNESNKCKLYVYMRAYIHLTNIVVNTQSLARKNGE